jgi:dipeptidyl aminopeptidase/acylaminoacyl peptidase
MTLAAGTRLGPYEIVSLLGAGGMGEVYRARDPRLGREVAVKVLPESLADDPDRLRRFELEAKAAGALNHPNVLAVLDLGQHEGMPYVVSELLEGETLGERMRSALPQRKALDIGAQIARGLAAAHEKGIIHRDLKPANLFVTRDGRVKILDFGLAKLMQREARDSQASTRTDDLDPGTTPGAILGTVGYMSPEQVKGLPADHRSDIFSLGVVLFEMLAGKRAFQGETAPETMTAILRHDPLETETARGLPPGPARIVRRCLQKDPSERFQSTHDLAFDLASLTEVSGTAQAAPPVASRRWRPLVVAASILLLAATALLIGLRLRPARGIPDYSQLTSRRGAVLSARFAPDGETVVFSAEWPGRPLEVFSTWGTSATSRPLGLKDAKVLAISRQGELAVALRPSLTTIWTHVGTLARVPLAGGTPRELAENVQDADWSPDGQSLAVVRWIEGRCRLEYPLGAVVYEPPPPAWLSDVKVSPKGDRLAFAEHPAPNDKRGSVVVMDLRGRRLWATGVFDPFLGLAWEEEDEGLLVSGARGAARGIYMAREGKEQVAGRFADSLDVLDLGRGHRLLVRRDLITTVTMGLAAGASHEQDLSENDLSFVSALSPDGATLVGTAQQGANLGSSMFVKRTDGTPSVNLGEGDALALSWDSKWVLARIAGNTAERLVAVPTGAGEPRQLPAGELDHYFEGNFLPDGRRVLFSAEAKGSGKRLFVQDLAGGPPQPIGSEGYSLPSLGSAISPDGKRAVVFGPDYAPLLLPIEGGEPVPIPGLQAGDVPISWTADGRGLYFYDAEADTVRLQRLDLASGRSQLARDLVPVKPAGMIGHFRILVSADGRSYVYSHSQVRGDLFLIQGLW